jgi:hypothetical protein
MQGHEPATCMASCVNATFLLWLLYCVMPFTVKCRSFVNVIEMLPEHTMTYWTEYAWLKRAKKSAHFKFFKVVPCETHSKLEVKVWKGIGSVWSVGMLPSECIISSAFIFIYYRWKCLVPKTPHCRYRGLAINYFSVHLTLTDQWKVHFPLGLTISKSSFCVCMLRMIFSVNSDYFLKQR